MFLRFLGRVLREGPGRRVRRLGNRVFTGPYEHAHAVALADRAVRRREL
ncbi:MULTISPECIES: hypothetical protein [Streptomyces]|uniref:Uncharacterized protein n=1 Tax=Streptomyces spinosisporus TaxID=2927582 RepID=A0ABS9XUK0_9ACTN|nr:MULTISPECIES: hypothetical protein [Streptomyces]MCI3245745.1 hypothetical protein [Streptomyces spinosisporus]